MTVGIHLLLLLLLYCQASTSLEIKLFANESIVGELLANATLSNPGEIEKRCVEVSYTFNFPNPFFAKEYRNFCKNEPFRNSGTSKSPLKCVEGLLSENAERKHPECEKFVLTRAKMIESLESQAVLKEIFEEGLLKEASLKRIPAVVWELLGHDWIPPQRLIVHMTQWPVACSDTQVFVKVCQKREVFSKGKLYKVMHIGSITNDQQVFRYRELPSFLFHNDEEDTLVHNCTSEDTWNRICDGETTKQKDPWTITLLPLASHNITITFAKMPEFGERDLDAMKEKVGEDDFNYRKLKEMLNSWFYKLLSRVNSISSRTARAVADN